jgi:hypothetical protein
MRLGSLAGCQPWLPDSDLSPTPTFNFTEDIKISNQFPEAVSVLSYLHITMVSIAPASSPDLISLILEEEGNITLCFIPSMPLSCSKQFHRLSF